MKIENFLPHRFVNIPAALVLLLTFGAGEAFAVKCTYTKPEPHEIELRRAIEDLDAATPVGIQCPGNTNDRKPTGWNGHSDPTFGSWGGFGGKGGSLNLPVLVAAIGLYRYPNQTMRYSPTNYPMTYHDWMVVFLAAQTRTPLSNVPGDPYYYAGLPAPSDAANLFYFQGTEEFSSLYSQSVVTSVVAVRYWAYRTGDGLLQKLTTKYLRAIWAIDALAAAPGPVWTYDMGTHPNGTPGRRPIANPVPSPSPPPARNVEFNPAAPRKKGGGYLYVGHFLALAGGRSTLGTWNGGERFALFDRAIGNTIAPTNSNEAAEQGNLLGTLETKWAGLGALDNVYGLDDATRGKLSDLVGSADKFAVTSAVDFVLPWLKDIRIASTYRILGWGGSETGGVTWRASCMEANKNHNTPNMYGVVYTSDDPNDANQTHALATFLFPWWDKDGAKSEGFCRLEAPPPGKTQPVMHASNGGGDNKHPPQEVLTNLPAAQPWFHVVLSQGAAAYLDRTAPASWPPPPAADAKAAGVMPPVATPPNTAFDGDTAWVFNDLPTGATASTYLDQWNWTDTTAPTSEALLVHQSNAVAGLHQHYFEGATDTMVVNAGETLYAYVYLDPANPPSEIMLQWSDAITGWNHRAFWGADRITSWGTLGTASRRYMGPLPKPPGEWLRLEVPAAQVDLEGRTVTGMAYTLFDGAATWDEAGKSTRPVQPTNLAVGGAATQSSTYIAAPPSGPAGLAIDGNPDGKWFANSMASTNYDYQAWWQLDLGASFPLDSINIWNRTDCCGSRLSNFYVFVSDQPFASNDLYSTYYQSGVSSYYFGATAGNLTTLGIARTGRYVRVQLAGTNYLSLAEVEVFGQYGSGPPTPTPTPTPLPQGDVVWVEDGPPPGASLFADNGDGWLWIGAGVSPGPYSGSFAHQSNVYGAMHQHYFMGATGTLSVGTGDKLVAYVYLDPQNPPSEIMLQWDEGGATWAHRAYWGANQLGFGIDGRPSRYYMGSLPAAGQWIRLEVPASLVGLEGRTVNGMAFTLYGGRATWDRAGKRP